MLDRKQTINDVEYAYHYGGNGTIRITEPVQVTIDLKAMPKLEIMPNGPVSDEQKAHLDGAVQTIVADMFAQMPGRA